MAGVWRAAESLLTLRRQLNAAYPNRSKASDGLIGDDAHAEDKTSDHNPDSNGVVAALDVTHDPSKGLDIAVLSEALRTARDYRIKYVIANKKIFGPFSNWQWQNYIGDNPHEKHMHVSVNRVIYDDAREWNINAGGNMNGVTKEELTQVYKDMDKTNKSNAKLIDDLYKRLDQANKDIATLRKEHNSEDLFRRFVEATEKLANK